MAKHGIKRERGRVNQGTSTNPPQTVTVRACNACKPCGMCTNCIPCVTRPFSVCPVAILTAPWCAENYRRRHSIFACGQNRGGFFEINPNPCCF